MDTRIFLRGFNSKVSSNTSEGLNVQFKGKKKLLPLDDVANVVSQYDEYKNEREKCNIIRLTCQVNPICSNVLFNKITEIVRNEGYSGVSFLNYKICGADEDGRSYRPIARQEVLFSGVTYKPNSRMSPQTPIDFWGGSTLRYEGLDTSISTLDSDETIEDAIVYNPDFNPNSTLNRTEYQHPTNAIRDMQLSSLETPFVYHCGLDVLNNHLIRSNTFKCVCRLPWNGDDYNPYRHRSEYEGFNTICDMMRDVNGNKVVEKISFPSTAPLKARLVALHLYEYDDLYTFENSVRNRLISKHNGWVGFENKSKIKSYLNFNSNLPSGGIEQDTEAKIERPLIYMNGGDFVDMYPGHDLYSFVPKYNNFRKRIEKNWNYCITYPSSSYTPTNEDDPFSDIIECNDGLNSLKTVYFNENTRADNGVSEIVMYSAAKHGLSKGDHINIYKTYQVKQYWVVDNDNVRISKKYSTLKEAEDELNRLKIESQTSVLCGKTVRDVIPKDEIVSSVSDVFVNEKILDNAEVENIVDEYIFTVYNSTTQISGEWIELSKQVLNGEPLVVGDRVFNIDTRTRKFLTENGKSTLYYIVNDEYVNIDESAQRISFKKVVSDIECDYYVRIFSKLPNFKFASADTSNEYELYKDNEKTIHDYQDVAYDFENHVSRLAFAKNIYSDEVGEIVFTDDIDISNIHDNLGRPLTSLYLTIIKNNKGYKEWYGYDYNRNDWSTTDISGDTVEFSHAFGKITCGIQTSYEANYGNAVNCINRITNINDSVENVLGDYTKVPSGYTVGGIINDANRNYVTENGKVINIPTNEIWYDTDKHFYGDLCYYDGYNAIERHISYIMHRFNTAQREASLSQSSNNDELLYFRRYLYDEIVYDDYDTSEGYKVSALTSAYDCDNKREGYYYNPHYEIPIKTFDKIRTMMPDFLTIRQMLHISGNTYQITVLQQHFLSIGDKAMIYDSNENRYYNLVTISGSNDSYKVFTCLVYDEKTNKPSTIKFVDGLDEDWDIENLSTSANTVSNNGSKSSIDLLTPRQYKLFKLDNLSCPSYARVLKDGTCRVIWRDVLNNGFNESDKSVEEYPFTNGAFYVNRRVDLYVRRQDPHNEYGLYDRYDLEGLQMDIVYEDNFVKNDEIEC